MRAAYATAPLVLMGFDVKPEKLYSPVKITSIVPTLAHFMRIRAPNACSEAPMLNIRK